MLTAIERKILQHISYSEGYVSGEELSKLCNVSINTIRKEIELINQELTHRGCTIETKVAVGYSLIVQDPEIAASFLTQSLKEFRRFDYLNYAEYSTAYLITLKLLTASAYTSIESLVDALFCSRSTILRTLEQVQTILSPFELEVKVRRNYGLILQGSEWSKRLCLIFMHKVFVHENKPKIYSGTFGALFLNQTDYPQTLMDQVQTYFGNHPDITIPNIHLIKIVQYILLARTRSYHADEIDYSPDQRQKIQSLPAYQAANQLYSLLPAYFQENLQETDRLSLAVMIACCMTLRSTAFIPDPQRQAMLTEVQEILAFLSHYYELDGCFDDPFYDAFACYLYCLHLKKEFHFSTDSEELTTSTKVGLWTAELCSLFALFYKLKYAVQLDETDLTEAYYILNAAIYKQNYTFDKMKVAVVSRQGRYYSESFAVRLMMQASRYLRQIEILEVTELFDPSKTDYDAILTDLYPGSLPACAKTVIELNHHPNDAVFEDLAQFLVCDLNRKALPLFPKQNFHKTHFSDKQAVYHAIYKQVQNQFSDQEEFFRDLELRGSFISNEKKHDLVLITTLALRTQQPCFEVFVNRKPIFWNQNKARVFIFYQYGNGRRENVQKISHLLKQFIHQNPLFLNTLYDQSYEDIISNFNIL